LPDATAKTDAPLQERALGDVQFRPEDLVEIGERNLAASGGDDRVGPIGGDDGHPIAAAAMGAAPGAHGEELRQDRLIKSPT
jgi:hypothetical protein